MTQAVSDEPVRHRWTVAEYHQMAEIFGEDARIELIEGELIDMSPIGPLHAAVVNDIAESIIQNKSSSFIVSIQNPIVLGDASAPQPDIAILRQRPDRYHTSLPEAHDVLLLIEVADSSLNFDRQNKIPLYARHSIDEVWLIDLPGKALSVYRQADPIRAEYQSLKTYRQGLVQATAVQGLSLDLAQLF